MSRFDDEKLKILRAIYEEAFRPGSLSSFSIDDLGRVLPPEMIFGLTGAIVESLYDDKYLSYEHGYYRISSEGIRYAEFIFEDLASNSSVDDRAKTTLADGIPAADRFVELNHNGDPYKETIKALDEAVVAFKEDHLFNNEWAPEKNTILKTIEAGRELLTESKIRIATLYTTIINPLRIVRARYEEAIAAGLVTAGVDHLIPLLDRATSLILSLFRSP